jgi:hypothetical protein
VSYKAYQNRAHAKLRDSAPLPKRQLSAAEKIARAKSKFAELELGSPVSVRRYGRDYAAVVSYVGKRGAKKASFRYGNGAEREVAIEWGDLL